MSFSGRSRHVAVALLIGLGTVSASPTTDKVRAGPDPAVDTFERQTLGSNWAIHNGDLGIVDGRALGVLSKSGRMLGLGIATWNATFAADQFSEAVIAPGIDPKSFAQVFVRRRSRDAQRYGFHWSGQWQIKRDGGFAAPVLATAAGPTPTPGDTIRIEAAGSVIRGFHNGVEVIRANDSVLTEPGQPGVALNVVAVTVFPTPFFKMWRGGSLKPRRLGTPPLDPARMAWVAHGGKGQ